MSTTISHLSKVFAICAAVTILTTSANARVGDRLERQPHLRAVIDRLADGIHDLRGQTIRCDRERSVGVRISDQRTADVELATAVFEGCEVAVMVEAGQEVDDLGQRLKGRVTVRGLQPQASVVSMWLAGDDSIAEYNICGGSQYGIVISGRGNKVRFNTVEGNTTKGIFLVGKDNVVHGNTITANGTGIHVYSMVPIDRPNRAIFALEVPAWGNVITGNYFSGNSLDMWDSKRVCNQPDEWLNEWSGNHDSTRKPDCLE
jgi:hypothetical protein